MKLRELVTDDGIKAHCKGQENNPIWDTELTEDDLTQLADPEYLARIEREETEFQAYMTFRYGNSKYRPDDLAKHAGLPPVHVWGFLALRGRTFRGGLY